MPLMVIMISCILTDQYEAIRIPSII